MQCPCCSSYSLEPIKLQYGLSARRCGNCLGILIDLLAYRDWAEDFVESDPKLGLKNTPKLDEVQDNARALICPKCSKLMLKFRVDGDLDNRVDLCTACDEAWLDNGEWELLDSLALQGKLNKIFTEPWQRHIREESAEKAFQKRFEETLGHEDYEKLLEVKHWISSHSNQSDLIRFILRH